jgi:hypothetical protein
MLYAPVLPAATFAAATAQAIQNFTPPPPPPSVVAAAQPQDLARRVASMEERLEKIEEMLRSALAASVLGR